MERRITNLLPSALCHLPSKAEALVNLKWYLSSLILDLVALLTFAEASIKIYVCESFQAQYTLHIKTSHVYNL
jgi:hypothetical protein